MKVLNRILPQNASLLNNRTPYIKVGRNIK